MGLPMSPDWSCSPHSCLHDKVTTQQGIRCRCKACVKEHGPPSWMILCSHPESHTGHLVAEHGTCMLALPWLGCHHCLCMCLLAYQRGLSTFIGFHLQAPAAQQCQQAYCDHILDTSARLNVDE